MRRLVTELVAWLILVTGFLFGLGLLILSIGFTILGIIGVFNKIGELL